MCTKPDDVQQPQNFILQETTPLRPGVGIGIRDIAPLDLCTGPQDPIARASRASGWQSA